MPRKSRDARRLVAASVAAAAAAFGVAAAPASAEIQTSTLKYQCKYPLIGVKALDLKVSLDIPAKWPAGVATDRFKVTAEASAFDMADALDAVDGLYAISGVSTAFATVKTAQGFNIPAKTTVTIPKTVIPIPVPNPLALTATGSTPPLTFDEPGVETIVLKPDLDQPHRARQERQADRAAAGHQGHRRQPRHALGRLARHVRHLLQAQPG